MNGTPNSFQSPPQPKFEPSVLESRITELEKEITELKTKVSNLLIASSIRAKLKSETAKT